MPNRGAGVPVLVVLSWLACGGPAIAQTPVTAGYRDFSFGPNGSSTPTGSKPESKLWWNDGSWWGSLFIEQANEYRIHRFDRGSQSWTDTGTTLDTRTGSKADVLWDETTSKLYVVSHPFTSNGQPTSTVSKWGRLYRYRYDATLQQYTLDSGFPTTVTRGTSETLVVAKDSVQRLWVTYVEAGRVKVNWSRAHDLDWGTPVTLPVSSTATSVTTDDIASVVAFGGAYIGIMWSNQVTSETYFTFRHDTDAPEVWQPIERVLPGVGCSGACTDDHLNLKSDQYGRVYAATKTSLESDADPLVLLAVRSEHAPATWTSYPIGLQRDRHTRPIVLLDEENNRVYAFATSGESGGAIYMKSSPLDDISFPPGLGQAVIKSDSDTKINNVTSTKQNVDGTTGLLVAAADQNTRYYLHGYLELGAGPSMPAAPTGLSASAGSSTRVELTWTDASADEDGFSIERASGGTTAFAEIAMAARNATAYSDASALPDTSYSYRVRARNTAGFSGYSNEARVTTPPAPIVTAPAPPTGLSATAVASAGIEVSWTDASTNEEEFQVERAIGQGSFAVLVTVPADFTNHSDSTVSAGSTYTYRVRARNAAGFSAYSNTATATTHGDPSGGAVPIKDITFEDATLTAATTGVDKVVGAVSLESASPLNGLYSARIPNVGSAYLEERFTAADDLYVSLYVRLNALPASDVRLVLISVAGTSVGNVVLRTSGRLRLRVDTTTVGAESAPLQVGQLYRIGIRQQRGTSANGVLQAFLASADDAFVTAFASTTAGAWNGAADRLRVGATTAKVIDVVVDDVRLDDATMPRPAAQ